MQEITDNGTASTDKCNATTGENILSILAGTRKAAKPPEKTTRSKQPESGTSDSSVKHEPQPRFLLSELRQWTFQNDGNRYRADDTEHTAAWIRFISMHAELPEDLDWEDLEERAHFLNMLSEHCEKRGIPFPLQEAEKINENINAC